MSVKFASPDRDQSINFLSLQKCCDDVKALEPALTTFLSRGGSLDMRDKSDQTLLMKTCLKGDVPCVMLLVSKGSDIEAKDSKGRSSISLAAAENSCSNVVKYLLEAGADVNSVSSTGATALHIACDQDAIENVMILADKADLNAKDSLGNTALHRACSNNSLQSIKFLIDRKVSLDIQNNSGATAVHCAAEGGYLEAVRLLVVQSNADLMIKNGEGNTVTRVGSAATRLAIAALLAEAGKSDIPSDAAPATPTAESAKPARRASAVSFEAKARAAMEAKAAKTSTPSKLSNDSSATLTQTPSLTQDGSGTSSVTPPTATATPSPSRRMSAAFEAKARAAMEASTKTPFSSEKRPTTPSDNDNLSTAIDEDRAYRLRQFDNGTDKEIGYSGDHPSEEFGTFRWQSGNVYVGELKFGKKDGKGRFTWKSGAIYDGEWKDDLRNGFGTYTSANSKDWVYEGFFMDDLYEGKGIYRWPDGRVYEGFWKKGKQEGQGILCSADGAKIYDGLWIAGKTMTSLETKAEEFPVNYDLGMTIQTPYGAAIILEIRSDGVMSVEPTSWIVPENKPAKYFISKKDLTQRNWTIDQVKANQRDFAPPKTVPDGNCICF